jgi:hypothetical protein
VPSSLMSGATRDRLPRADVILCRDCLVHVSFQDTAKILDNFRSTGTTWLLLNTCPEIRHDRNQFTGGDGDVSTSAFLRSRFPSRWKCSAMAATWTQANSHCGAYRSCPAYVPDGRRSRSSPLDGQAVTTGPCPACPLPTRPAAIEQ